MALERQGKGKDTSLNIADKGKHMIQHTTKEKKNTQEHNMGHQKCTKENCIEIKIKKSMHQEKKL